LKKHFALKLNGLQTDRAESDVKFKSNELMGTEKKLRAIIVDDEELARRMVKEYLQKHTDIDAAAEAANGFDAVKLIMELEPDLVFLDIQMPKLNGFEVLELTQRKSGVVFITAYDAYAIKAFEVHALDYLLKPFSQQRFDEALAYARKHLKDKEPLAGLVSPDRTSEPLERVLIREGQQVHVIAAEKIDVIEAQDDYIRICSGSQSYLKTQSLSEIEKQLDSRQFVRVHRSYILNVERIARIELYAKDSHRAILKDGTQIPISRSGYERVKELL
jgi:two-component system LytT family response regulator